MAPRTRPSTLSIRADHAVLRRSTRAAEGRILPRRLAEFLGRHRHVAEIVGDLIGLAEPITEEAPGFGRRIGGERAPTWWRG